MRACLICVIVCVALNSCVCVCSSLSMWVCWRACNFPFVRLMTWSPLPLRFSNSPDMLKFYGDKVLHPILFVEASGTMLMPLKAVLQYEQRRGKEMNQGPM